MSTVEQRYRQQIDQPQIDTEKGRKLKQRYESKLSHFTGHSHNANGAGDIGFRLAREHLPYARKHFPGYDIGMLDGK